MGGSDFGSFDFKYLSVYNIVSSFWLRFFVFRVFCGCFCSFLLFLGFSFIFYYFCFPKFPVEEPRCSSAIHSNSFFIFDFSGTTCVVYLGWGVVVLSLCCVFILFLVIVW